MRSITLCGATQWGKLAASFVGADASGNGIVDDADYSIWRNHFGESVPPVGSGAAFGSAQAIAASTSSNVVVDGPKSVALSAGLGDGTFAPVPDASSVYYRRSVVLSDRSCASIGGRFDCCTSHNFPRSV